MTAKPSRPKRLAAPLRTGIGSRGGPSRLAPSGQAGADGSDSAPCPIVGIGASAGGLEAVRELLEHLPPDTGLAFVVVQHLAPDHASLLSEILSKATPMPVRQVRDGERAVANHVYVIVPGRELTVRDGVFRVARRRSGEPQVIDRFLESLVADAGDRATGVVLSGTGSDGTRGLRAIMEVGGLTFAQDGGSARFPEMPARAAADGTVDRLLRPRVIAEDLAKWGRELTATPEDAAQATGGEDDLVLEILQRLRSRGFDLADYRLSTIRRRLVRRMALAGFKTLRAYLAALRSDPKEAAALYEDVLINVTAFFRDPAAYRLVVRRVLPAILEKREPDAAVRIWVAGCSSGEEAYSLGMLVLEQLGKRRDRSVRVQIFGSDASNQVIEKARAGVYGPGIARDVSTRRLQRFFARTKDGYRVGQELRDMCVFAKHNVARDPPFSRVDFISCRNLLIYLAPPLQETVLSVFHYALVPGGWLLLGPTEHVPPTAAGLFSEADASNRLFVRKDGPARAIGRLRDASARPFTATTTAAGGSPPTTDVQREADLVVMSRYAPAGVIVDEDMSVVQYRGPTGPFLDSRPGPPTQNVLKLAREGLALPLRSAFRKARETGVSQRRDGVRIRVGGKVAEVSIEVVPLRAKEGRGRLYLVLFGPSTPSSPGKSRGRAAKGRDASAEGELEKTKELLQTVVQEQEATNQELSAANQRALSSNEELQSTNEELETAKEELQSSNEELTTVNEELQVRNRELAVAHEDMANFLGSSLIPMAVLGADLRIRRVSPAAEKLLNVLSTDTGRLVTDFRSRVPIDGLASLVASVVEDGPAQEVEVVDESGRSYLMRVRPYQTRDDRIDGVVVSWHDVETLRQKSRQTVREISRAVLDGMPWPAAVVGGDLLVEIPNRAWRDLWPEGAGGVDSSRPWRDIGLDDALDEVLTGGTPLAARDVDVLGKAMRATAERIPWDHDERRVMVTFLPKAMADAAEVRDRPR